jgi:2-polyprenyl-3-methyl-5-hydroxy-6-metoxy-1,4-benzoquinol methylase
MQEHDTPHPSNVTQEQWIPGHGGERMTDGIDYGWQMRDHLARYHFAVQHCRGKRVLDVATGSGYGADILHKHGASEVVAVDRDDDALGYARKRYGSHGLRWVNGDAYALPFGSEFDVVVSYETIEHLKEPERFVIECKRVLRPDGLYIVSTPLNVGGPFVSRHHELEFSRAEFEELLGRHFSSVVMFGQRRELRESSVKPLGNLPDRYLESHIVHGRGNVTLFKLADRINKAPAHVIAWASGWGETIRSQIRPLCEPMRLSPLVKPNYFAMIAFCRP